MISRYQRTQEVEFDGELGRLQRYLMPSSRIENYFLSCCRYPRFSLSEFYSCLAVLEIRAKVCLGAKGEE